MEGFPFLGKIQAIPSHLDLCMPLFSLQQQVLFITLSDLFSLG